MKSITLRSNEWQNARAYFANNPLAIKLKKQSPEHHSFIKVDNVIYAMQNKHRYLGHGTVGKVKLIESENGENRVVKIEGHKLTQRDIKEDKMTRRIGFSYGLAERKLDQVKKFSLGERSWDTDTKVYKVLEYLPGENIWTAIHKPLTEVQQLIIAIKWCQALKNVHKNRIIHRDAKEDNANVLINGNDIQVKCSDYGYAVELLDGQDESHDYTIGGSAPEVKKLTNGKPIFSTKSDVHSLGISFQRSFSAIPKDIIDGMLRENRFERDSLDVVSNKLAKHLSTKQNLDSHAIKVITDLGLAKPSSQRKPAVLPSQDTKTKSKSKSSFFKSFINDKRSAKELVIAAVIIVGVIGIAALIYKKMKIRKKMKKMRKYVSGFTL